MHNFLFAPRLFSSVHRNEMNNIWVIAEIMDDCFGSDLEGGLSEKMAN
jgi:hypothetical protein